MKEFFEYTEELTVNDVDCNLKMTLAHTVDVLQILANENAERGGYGFKALLDNNNAFWVLTKIKIKCNTMPLHREKVVCKTWPITPGKLTLERDFEIKDNRGKVAVAATSEWCLIDAETRRIKRIDGNTVMPNIDYIEARALVGEFTKQKIEIGENDFCFERVIRSTDIDMNGHANNTRYTFMAMDCFTTQFLKDNDIDSYEIHFVKECTEGDKLLVFKKQISENGYYITATKGENQTVFRAFVNFK